MIVFVELARRRVPVEFAERKLGDRSLPARASYLPFKLNSAGLIPTVVGPWLLLLPLTLAGFAFGFDSPWIAAAFQQITPGRLLHMIVGSVVIVILAFVYTAFVVDPEHAADLLEETRRV